MSDLETLSRVAAEVNLAAVIDSSGRGGNLFFLTLFDLHPEVACCPVVQYSYSYVLAEFADETVIDAQRAHRFVTQKSYFRLLYNDPVGDNGVLFERMGGHPEAGVDRPRLRALIDAYFSTRSTVTRREIIAAPLVAQAMVRGMDSERLRYVLIGDAISKREEDVSVAFSGSMVDRIVEDFPAAKIFRLVRDPRATFASPRHQFVNSLGNMYAIKPGNYFSRLWTLMFGVLTPENSCVYLYWLLYLRQTERAICRKEAQYPERFMVAKNEDLNLRFPYTMPSIAQWLGVALLDTWKTSDFVPTVNGIPWEGAGAYNSRYQRATSGLLENDPADVARTVTGPNEYVTRRWRTRLNRREIALIEHLFHDALKTYGYEFLNGDTKRSSFVVFAKNLLGSFEGELPNLKWIRRGFSESVREGGVRCFYALTFPVFYVVSRVRLLHLHAKGVL